MAAAEARLAALLGRLPALWGRGEYHVTRAVLLRLLGLAYLAAFASLWGQVGGLVGSGGIWPVAEYMAALKQHLGPWGWLQVPTLLWLDAGDLMLGVLCGGGVLLAAGLVAGWAFAPVLLLLWLFYLSLALGCRDFLAFQWDVLLLEAGFLAVLWAPWQLRPGLLWRGEPSRTVLWLWRALLFRLMLSSGAVKLLSGDATWRDLSALQYHFMTQPLPTWTAWYVHQWPAWLLEGGVAATLFIELVLPFGVWGSRRVRLWTAAAFALLQIAIGLSGNYGFFNLLTLVLCVSLLDDAFFRKGPLARLRLPPVGRQAPRILVWACALVLGVLGGASLLQTLKIPVPLAPLERLQAQLRPFRLVNTYGLFAVMTTRRPEIIVEGSRDGTHWQAYRFKWKPGPVERRPLFAGLHMPRLDWQMWFAALGSYQRQAWFLPFMQGLLEAKPAVTALLAADPFDGAAPRYVRARVYEYRFSDRAGRAATGDWWTRRYRGPYCPVLSLKG